MIRKDCSQTESPNVNMNTVKNNYSEAKLSSKLILPLETSPAGQSSQRIWVISYLQLRADFSSSSLLVSTQYYAAFECWSQGRLHGLRTLIKPPSPHAPNQRALLRQLLIKTARRHAQRASDVSIRKHSPSSIHFLRWILLCGFQIKSLIKFKRRR